jgi:dipeptidyl aminopeptidase/acylaminoacyl peptidase
MIRTTVLFALAIGQSALAQTDPAADAAARFGAQAAVSGAALSPDGKHIAYIGPGPGRTNAVFIVDITAGTMKPIAKASGDPERLTGCDWSAADRLVCNEYGLFFDGLADTNKRSAFTRMFAIDVDGKNMLALGNRDTDRQLYARQFDGEILDWGTGSSGTVLMSRYYVPEMSTGSRTAQTDEGYGVDLIDTRNQKVTHVEPPKDNTSYLTDGRGNVRIMVRYLVGSERQLSGKRTIYYRTPDDRQWRELDTGNVDDGMEAVAVDSGINAVYVLKLLDGRRALYRISLDGSMKSELVFAHPKVDVSNVVTIGRSGHVIGASYYTEQRQIEYFDPTYVQLSLALSRAVPQLPLISFTSASADEKLLLVLARSDNDPGRYYLLDRNGNRLTQFLSARPELEKTTLASVKAVVYPAADGTPVPAYLTLPPGKDSLTGLPAIVMPHGGPGLRDVWGFDWLAQYFANRGFAVLQPNFRGSAGYGNGWFLKNGFQSWKTAIGDVVDGGRWLISQGASAEKLAIVGGSYGGYAALQSAVVNPELFKAVVAIAPVTDLTMLKAESEGFTNERLERDYIGDGPHIEEASPARHADRFRAPVLLFHGESDATVTAAESRAMDKALKSAGKSSQLIVYPKLDHQFADNTARADMLQRSYDFLRLNLKL